MPSVCEASLYSILCTLYSVLCTLLASPKLLLLGIVKVNFFSALAYSQLYLLSVLCYLYSIYKILGSP